MIGDYLACIAEILFGELVIKQKIIDSFHLCSFDRGWLHKCFPYSELSFHIYFREISWCYSGMNDIWVRALSESTRSHFSVFKYRTVSLYILPIEKGSMKFCVLMTISLLYYSCSGDPVYFFILKVF